MQRPLVILVAALAIPALAPAQVDSVKAPDPIPPLVARLDLERYKATIKGLTAFGDRRQGTDRNRAAIDWIEARLKSYGCVNTERLKYEYQPAPAVTRAPAPAIGTAPTSAGGGAAPRAAGGGRPRGVRTPTGVNTDPNAQP